MRMEKRGCGNGGSMLLSHPKLWARGSQGRGIWHVKEKLPGSGLASVLSQAAGAWEVCSLGLGLLPCKMGEGTRSLRCLPA